MSNKNEKYDKETFLANYRPVAAMVSNFEPVQCKCRNNENRYENRYMHLYPKLKKKMYNGKLNHKRTSCITTKSNEFGAINFCASQQPFGHH